MPYNIQKALERGCPKAIARVNGDKFYKSIEPCPRNHDSLRYTKFGQCVECTKELKLKYRLTEKGKAKDKEYADKNKNQAKINSKKNFLIKKYGLTFDEFNKMVTSQNNKCLICTNTFNGSRHGANVDHCHTTGKVRGILCRPCNLALGFFRDNPETMRRAAIYCESA